MRTAVVVGAGVAGLATAGSLARAGWQVTLIERGERLRSAGGAQILWPNGLAALAALGLNIGDLAHRAPSGGVRRPDGRVLVEPVRPRAPQAPDEPVRLVQPASVYRAAAADAPGAARAEPMLPPPGLDALAAGPGLVEPVAEPVRPGFDALAAGPDLNALAAGPVVMHADDLHDLLMSGLGDRIEIRTGTEVTSLTLGTDWPAVNTARHTFQADLVVGADGAESALRRRLAPGTRIAPAGYTAWRALVPWFRVPALAAGVPDAGEMLGAGMRFCHTTLGQRWAGGEQIRGGIYWWATVPGASRPEPVAVQLSLLRRWFVRWHSPVAELLEATQASDLIPQPAVHLAPVPELFGMRVGGGGVVLVGDAAHAITPSLTQGAGLALEDAAVLGEVMRSAVPGGDLAGRLGEYTRSRRDRVVRVGRAARRLDRVVQAQGRLAVATRDALLARLTPRLVDPAVAEPFTLM
ncbi:MAG TPA: FAD-dependent oxidoreductase [Micromonosporaceae bacterium]